MTQCAISGYERMFVLNRGLTTLAINSTGEKSIVKNTNNPKIFEKSNLKIK